MSRVTSRAWWISAGLLGALGLLSLVSQPAAQVRGGGFRGGAAGGVRYSPGVRGEYNRRATRYPTRGESRRRDDDRGRKQSRTRVEGGGYGSVRLAGSGAYAGSASRETKSYSRDLGDTGGGSTGYKKTYHRGKSYYVKDGHFYSAKFGYGKVDYTQVDPPVGAVVAELGGGCGPATINGKPYYVGDGIYYEKVEKRGRISYVVVEPPQ